MWFQSESASNGSSSTTVNVGIVPAAQPFVMPEDMRTQRQSGFQVRPHMDPGCPN